MRMRTIWILALLCLLFGLTLASAAQTVEGSPEDNACYTGGSLEGRCDWPTDAEDAWAWHCGWYIARVDIGVFTVNDVPAWCNYFVAPQIVCYDSADPGQVDFILSAALNTASNASGYSSVDGSCSGSVSQTDTIVTAVTALDAAAVCESLLGPSYANATSLRNVLHYNAPGTWWGCVQGLT